MPVSFREKSQWIVLVALVVAYARYFAHVLPDHGPDVAPGDIRLFIGAVVTLVILQVAGHVLLAIATRREVARGVQRDERDRLVDLRAGRVGAHVLAVAVVTALSTALLVPGNFAFMHVLFGGWVLAHVVEIATGLVLYRRGG